MDTVLQLPYRQAGPLPGLAEGGGEQASHEGLMGRVLVVEDDDDNRRFLQELLLLDTHEVHTARNGRDALAWLRTQRTLPHCIVLDLDMPIMNGEEFFRRLQDEPRFAHIRVIVLSGDPHRQTKDLPPTVARLEKPAPPEMLTDIVARCTRHPLARRPAQP